MSAKKYFFYVQDSSGAVERSLGIRFLDVDAAAIDAVTIADNLQSNGYSLNSSVVVVDQRGKMIARVSVGACRTRATAV
jgi:hypothetical protein